MNGYSTTMNEKGLAGVVIALPTPLHPDETVDVESLCRLMDHTINGGADAIMIGGTMGEGVALLDSQKRILVETAVAHNAGRITLLATVSETSTKRSIDFVRSIRHCPVDYWVCTSPYYNKFPDPQSVLTHITEIRGSSDRPLVFYNAPLATGNPVDVDTLDRILNMEGIAGVKDSSTNFGLFMEMLRRYPKGDRPASIMQGDESVFDVSLLLGADGVVSGGGVVFVELLKELYATACSNNPAQSMVLQRRLSQELRALLGPRAGRDWVAKIKQRLVDMDVIGASHVSAPFLTHIDTVGDE